MVSTYYANDTYFDFQSLGDVGGLWDPTFDISPIDSESITTGPPSIDEAFVNTTDPAASIIPLDASIDMDLPALDNFDFISSQVPIAKDTFSPANPSVSCGESTGCPISHRQHQDAKSQDLMQFDFGNTAGYPQEIEECVAVPCLAPITALSASTSKRKSESVSSKTSSLRNSPPPNAKVKKQSRDIEGSLHGTQGTRGSKTAHSIIERKYRENLNAKITQLRQTLSVTGHLSQEDSRHSDEGPALNMAKSSKGDVLASTIDYIQHAEIDKRHMSEEIKFLRSQLAATKRRNKCEDCSVLTRFRALQFQVPV